MDPIQLMLLPAESKRRGYSLKPVRHDAALLLFLNAFLYTKMRAREYQLVMEQSHSTELLGRLQLLQNEVEWLSKELKQAEKDNLEKKKRTRVYKRQCVECSETFNSKSFDRNYCDNCRSISEQRRRGFNRGKGKLT
jgi:hypothetical protein